MVLFSVCVEEEKLQATRNDDSIHLSWLSKAHNGALPDEGLGQVLAHAVRQVLRVPVRSQRKVLLQGQQALLQERLFQASLQGCVKL